MIKSGLGFYTHGQPEFVAADFRLAREKQAHAACGRGRDAWAEGLATKKQQREWRLALTAPRHYCKGRK